MRRAIAFAVALLIPVYYAVNGGSYDLLTRHEEALVIWILLEVGFAFGLLPRARLSWLAWVAMGALAAIALLTLLSVGWTESDGRTVDELARIAHYGGIVLLALSALNRYTWRAAAGGLVGAALAVCALAVTARLAPDVLHDDVGSLLDVRRLAFPLDYWNATAAWGAMSLAGALAWSAHSRQSWVRAAALAMVPVAGLAIYLSYSRAGVASALIGWFFVLVLSRNRWTAAAHAIVAAAGIAVAILVTRGQPEIADGIGAAGAGAVLAALLAAGVGCGLVALTTAAAGMDRMRMPKQSARIAIAVGAIAVLLVGVTAARGPISDAWDEFQNQTTVEVGDDPATRLASLGGTRSEAWDSALDAYASEPLSGVGPGTFEFWWSRNGPPLGFARDAHSLYLEQLAELGLPGLLLLLAFLGTLVAAGFQARRSAERAVDAGAGTAMLSMCAVYLVFAGVDWMWEMTAVSMLGLGAAAVAAAGSSGRRRRPLRPVLRVAIVVTCLLAAMIQIPGLVSTARTRESETLMARGDLARAAELADQAVDAEPWASEPYMQRAAVSEALGELDSARTDLLDAIEREPTNWRPAILLAQVELQRGDEAAARSAFADARRLHPYSAFYSTFPLFRSQILGSAPPSQ